MDDEVLYIYFQFVRFMQSKFGEDFEVVVSLFNDGVSPIQLATCDPETVLTFMKWVVENPAGEVNEHEENETPHVFDKSRLN